MPSPQDWGRGVGNPIQNKHADRADPLLRDGRWSAGRKQLELALIQDPGNPVLAARFALESARAGAITVEEAEATVSELAAAYSDQYKIGVIRAQLGERSGRRTEA